MRATPDNQPAQTPQVAKLDPESRKRMIDSAHAEALTQARIDISRLEVQVAHLSVSLADLQEVNKQQSDKIDKVLLALSEARGGWRTLMLVGGAASTAGAALAWVVEHLTK
jgi:hypothetical protein